MGGNPLRAMGNQMGSTLTLGSKNNMFGGGETTWSNIEDNDMVRGLTGRETSGERTAKAEQQAALASEKADAENALSERRKRMDLKKQGRGSLLSGTETGVATTSTLG
jgi:hypothetical protein